MKKIFHLLIFTILLCVLLGGYYLYESYRDAHQEKKKELIENTYITSVSGSAISAVVEGEKKEFEMAEVKGDIPSGLANLEIVDGIVVKVSIMPDSITGKVLSINNDEIEVEGYGKLRRGGKFKVYQLGEVIEMSSVEKIIVGYSGTRFVVANGKIQGAIIEKKIKANNIRVLIKTNNFASYEHQAVEVTATDNFTITTNNGGTTPTKEVTNYSKGTRVKLKEKQRYVIHSLKGKVTLLSLKRHNQSPSYRGTLEVKETQGGFHIINELPLEEYLYSVVPSEMPTTYGEEALKAQSICARSYAYGQILQNKLRKYGAHVDDSVSFQVYNNVQEDEIARKQVDATRGQVVMAGDKVATTYFFSTSCGVTSSAKDVWYTKNEVSYLVSKSQMEKGGKKDYSNSKNFEKLLSGKKGSYDSDSIWYRWNVDLKASDIKISIDKNILNRCESKPSYIQVKTNKGFESKKINTIGDVKSIAIVKRGAGGVIKTIEVKGSKETIRIHSEYNIRLLLSGNNTKVTCVTGDKIGGLSLLPSGFFIISKEKDVFSIKGGGFGHGVGMSQNGAKKMASLGSVYQEIIAHYYPGTTILSVY